MSDHAPISLTVQMRVDRHYPLRKALVHLLLALAVLMVLGVAQFEAPPPITRVVLDLARPARIDLRQSAPNVLEVGILRDAGQKSYATTISLSPPVHTVVPRLSTMNGRVENTTAPPMTVTADRIDYDPARKRVGAIGNVHLRFRKMRLTAQCVAIDLQAGRLTAQGTVMFASAPGRTSQVSTLLYDVQTDKATVIHDGRRGDPSRLRACAPVEADSLIIARALEITPREELIARQASLPQGSTEDVTRSIVAVSLQTPPETEKSVTRVGFDNVDGVWVDYEYKYGLGGLTGTLYTKFGTWTGVLPLNTLAYNTGNFGATLTLGRNQDKDFNVYDQAELTLALSSPAEQHPLSMSFSIGEGWFRESSSEVDTSRLTYTVELGMPPLPLGPQLSWEASASWRDSFYGTGARQGVLNIAAAITRPLDVNSSIKLAYDRLAVFGASPFVFDTVESDKISDDLSLEYFRTGVRGAGVETAYTYGVSYSFLDHTFSLDWEYREQLAGQFHWGIKVEHDLATGALKLTTDSGLAIGSGTFFTIGATYMTDTGRFKDLDYTITSRVSDCVDLELIYRQVKEEIWFVIDPRHCDP